MEMNYERHASGRMFETPFLEWSSRVHPSLPFIFYIPIVAGLLGRALWTHVTTVAFAVAFFVVGWVIWDVLEYVIHRGFFHWEGNGPITRRIHSIAHGYHHQYPDDPLRLVMPLGASIPLASVIAGLLWLVHVPAVTIPIFAGIVSAYLFYDFTHWSTHYRTPLTSWGKAIRAHHMAHHFAVHDKNFGISHRWIDAILGTLKTRPSRE
jgi:dihydroceramide fatty acyl 2-hydroxylase